MLTRVSTIACCLTLGFSAACTGEITVPGGTPEPLLRAGDTEPTPAVEPTPTAVRQEPSLSFVEPEPEPVSLLQAQVEDILSRTCGECHGVQGTAQAGLNSIEDLDALADDNLLVPGAADQSPLIARMLSGNMPPAGNPSPTEDEVQQIVQFVNSWDGPESPVAVVCSNSVVTFDSLFGLMQADLLGQEPNDRSSIRYLTFANRHNARVCGEELKVERRALSKLVNSLSDRSRIERPVAIDEDQLLFRIDIRDYGWDREVQVGDQSFDDGWEAIVDSSPYAVQFEGDEADFVNQVTQTAIPLLYADALLDAASVGPLYYGLLDIPQTSQQLLDDLLIDVEENRDRGQAVRAGTTQSGISRSERLVERHDVGAGAERAYWQSFDFGNGSNDSIFVDPLNFQEGESETIFTLLNGLQAYVIFDGDGNTVDESAVLFDTLQDNFRVRTAVSCMTCHSRGPLQVKDEVRLYVESSELAFNADERQAVLELYPGEERLNEIVEEDRDVYQRALTAAGVPLDRTDPVSDTFQRFNRDLTPLDIAGDLGISEEVLLDNLSRLDSRLRIASEISIDRNDFSALFLESLCRMQRVSRNRPLDETCDAL